MKLKESFNLQRKARLEIKIQMIIRINTTKTHRDKLIILTRKKETLRLYHHRDKM